MVWKLLKNSKTFYMVPNRYSYLQLQLRFVSSGFLQSNFFILAEMEKQN